MIQPAKSTRHVKQLGICMLLMFECVVVDMLVVELTKWYLSSGGP